MEEKDTTNITVLIAGRSYPLKIKVGDESAIRKIVKEVNEKVNRFQINYTKKDFGMFKISRYLCISKSNKTKMC